MGSSGFGGYAWIAEHAWLYPLLSALHVIGIALLLGSLVLLELRVWGLGAGLPVQALARLALPLTRMETWKVPEVKNGDKVAMLGFTFAQEKGDAILRVEYLLLGDKTYGLRSSPA